MRTMPNNRSIISKKDGTPPVGTDQAQISDERARIMLDATPLCVNVIDSEYNNIDCNQEAAKLFDLKDKQEYLEKFWELQPEIQPDGSDSKTKMKEMIDAAFKEGHCRFEWMHKKLDGELIPGEVTLVRVWHEDEHIILAYMRDLREYKKMIGEIQRRDELLHTINLAAAAMLTTADDIEFNKTFQSGMELIGHGLGVDRVQIWQNEEEDGVLHFVHKYEWLSETGKRKAPVPIGIKYPYSQVPEWEGMFLRGECINSPLNELAPGDQEFLKQYEIMSIVILPLFFHEQFWGFFSVDDCLQERMFTEEELNILRSASLMMASAFNRHTQVIEMKKAEENLLIARASAESANEAKSIFLANMSHEIRTPMNSIIGFTELAMDDVISTKTKEYLNKILENSEWLLQIINDILDISKIESGKLELEHIPFNLHEIFTHCQTAIMPKAMEKGLTLHFYAEPSIGKKLLGDPTRLRQIMINLLSNAIKFTRVGTIKVSSNIIKTTENSIMMHFEVRDSGIGMTTEQINRIYEPFMQADSSMTRKYGGTGLGLAICKNTIELFGGELIVESTPGLGSKFSFDLTFDTIDDSGSPEKKVSTISEYEKPVFDGEVLICEDNAMNQQVIHEHLKRVGLSVVVAQNGKEGVDYVRERVEKSIKPFDLILMDIHMPVMDGLEAAAIIAEMRTGTPIVAMTANIMSSDKELYEDSGLPDFISKPFTSQELWRCLMKYFTPLRREAVNEPQQIDADTQLYRQLQISFNKDNQMKISQIDTALDNGDIKLAHRLVHNLKSNAGQLGKTRLQEAAADAERLLKNGKNLLTRDKLDTLDTELKKVLDELAFLDNEPESATMPFNKDLALSLFEHLEPMLQSRNSECHSHLEQIRAIPGAELLAEQIEDFEFKAALETLIELKKKWM